MDARRDIEEFVAKVVEVEDGKVKSIHHYFDSMTMMAQLGVGAPAEAATA